MVDSLILIDSSSDINKLTSIISKQQKTKIISFDAIIHDQLSKMKIDHQKIEDYIDTNDQDLVNKLIVEKCLKWYQQEGISNLLQFENINLGWLMELDLLQYLPKTMKSFLGIIKIIDKESPTTITTTNFLSSMIKTIGKNKKINVAIIPTNQQSNLYLNKAIVPIRFGKKSVNLWIPLPLALKVAKIVESVLGIMFNLKPNLDHARDDESILLVDFNPKPFGGLFKELSNLKKNIILLNLRGPAVWNLNNLRSVIRSRTKIVKLSNLINFSTKYLIEQNQQVIIQKLNELNENKWIEEFFSIGEHSFWPCIKQSFIEMCMRRFREFIEVLILSKELFNKTKIKCVLVLYPNPEEKVILHIAQELKIPCIRLQHSLEVPGEYMEKFLPFFPHDESGVTSAVWSKKMKNYLLKLGSNGDRIIVTGNPRLDPLFHRKDQCKYNGTIMIASSLLQNIFELSGHDTNLSIKHQNVFSKICKIATNVSGKRVIIKLHPAVINSYDVQELINEIDPQIPIYKTQNIIDLMKDCDVFITMDQSTALLEAMILEKPTITVLVDSKWYEHDEMIASGATIAVRTSEEFEKALNNILFDNNFKKLLIQKGNKFVNDYLENHGNASGVLAKMLGQF